MTLRDDCRFIVEHAIKRVQPGDAVRNALSGMDFSSGRLILVAVGKAAWSMANAAYNCLDHTPDAGIVITKYDHAQGAIGELEIYEAGHPLPDANTIAATERALHLTDSLRSGDVVLFLLSGGGSALFEKGLLPLPQLQNITEQLLASGADIVEMNIIRKRLSAVKGGRFALHCSPARVLTVVLSDIIGDPLDMIGSGPAYPDSFTSADALKIAEKYRLELDAAAIALLRQETPKSLDNVDTIITGSVRELCIAAADACTALGYTPLILTDSLTCQAREAGGFLGSIARYHRDSEISLAFIAGGETVVRLRGAGKGGRNQELALAAAEVIAGLPDTAIFSIGSDGTDGPTDAAGGFVTGETAAQIVRLEGNIYDSLENNDAYPLLRACDGLIFTGATGTNVNDVAVLLIRRRQV